MSNTMKAAVITGVKKIEVIDVPMPVIGPREVLLKIKSAGLCTWEQRIYTGQSKADYPFLGGHENAGEIAAIGELVTNVAVGDRVTMGSSACGNCRPCLRGEDKGCAEHFLNFSLKGGQYGPGGFAQYKVHRSDGVFKVADAPWDQAALAEPLSCAIHGARLLNVRLGDTAVVFGAGTMGLMNLIVLKKSGLRVGIVDINEGRLEKAKSLGADLIFKTDKDIREKIKSAFLGGVDHAITAYGSDEVNQDALDVLNNRGKICLFASAHPVTPFAIDPNLMHNKETSAVGVVSADRRDHAVATDMIATKQVDLSPLIDKSYALADAAEAFEKATTTPSYRVMLNP
jgi:threonine dehydrogenase-like Zn-dependent dehydrogenase